MRKLSLLTLLGIVLTVGTGVAAAANAPSLTSTEYQQLVAYQNRTATQSLKTLAAVRAASRSCRDLSPASALLRAARGDCRATYAWLEASVSALTRVKACAHTHTSGARFSCLMSAYTKLARTARSLYRDDERLYRVVVARGFRGTCSRALSNGPKSLGHEAEMAKDITRMVAAMHERKLLAVQKWGSLYDAATAEAESSAAKVSVVLCPHQ